MKSPICCMLGFIMFLAAAILMAFGKIEQAQSAIFYACFWMLAAIYFK